MPTRGRAGDSEPRAAIELNRDYEPRGRKALAKARRPVRGWATRRCRNVTRSPRHGLIEGQALLKSGQSPEPRGDITRASGGGHMKGDSLCRDSVIGRSCSLRSLSCCCSLEWLRACSGLGSYSSRWRSASRETLASSGSTVQATMRVWRSVTGTDARKGNVA